MTMENKQNTIVDVPDFNDLMEAVETINTKGVEKDKLEIEIKRQVSKIIAIVRNEEKYFVNGKPPAMNFIEATYCFSGLDDELIPKRMELARVTSEWEHAKLILNVYKDMIDIWRTKSANKRRDNF